MGTPSDSDNSKRSRHGRLRRQADRDNGNTSPRNGQTRAGAVSVSHSPSQATSLVTPHNDDDAQTQRSSRSKHCRLDASGALVSPVGAKRKGLMASLSMSCDDESSSKHEGSEHSMSGVGYRSSRNAIPASARYDKMLLEDNLSVSNGNSNGDQATVASHFAVVQGLDGLEDGSKPSRVGAQRLCADGSSADDCSVDHSHEQQQQQQQQGSLSSFPASLPLAVPLDATASTDKDDSFTADIPDTERQLIREEAEKQARKKIEAVAVHAAVAQRDMKDDASSASKRRLIICAAILALIGGIIGVVLFTRKRSTSTSSSNSAGAGQTAAPTMNSVPTPLPTQIASAPPSPVQPVQARDSCASNNVCECAVDVHEDHLGTSVFGTTSRATTDAINTCDSVSANGAGVWYRVQRDAFLLQQSRRFMASLCEPPSVESFSLQATNYDTQISIFAGDRCDRLRCVAGNDQGGPGCADKSRASFTLGTDGGDDTYYIYVHGFRSSRGAFAMKLFELPNNLQCEDALVVSPTETTVSSTKGAFAQPSEMSICGLATSTAPGVWLKLTFVETPTSNNPTILKVDAITQGFVPEISVFHGSSCDDLDCIGGGTEIATVYPSAGTTYHILVKGVGNMEGDFAFSVVSTYPPSRQLRPFLINCIDAAGLPVGSNITAFIPALRPEEVDPIVSCGNDVLLDTRGSYYFIYRGSWFNTTGTGAIVRASTCHPGTVFDTKISVLTGDCDDLQCIDANNDGASDNGCSVVEWYAHEGVEYKLIVHPSEDRPYLGDPWFTLTLEEVEASANQTCQSATPIPTDGTATIGVVHPTMKTVKEMPPMIPIIVNDSNTTSDNHDEYLFWYSTKGTGQALTASTCHPGSMLPTLTSTSIYIFANDGETSSCGDLRQLTDITSASMSSPRPEDLIYTPCNDHMSATWKSAFDKEYFVVVKFTVDNAVDVQAKTNAPTEMTTTMMDTDSDTTALRPTFTLTVENAAVNDGCRSAIGPIPLDTNYRTVTTRSATRSFMDVMADGTIVDFPTCPSTLSPAKDQANGRDVWFTFIGNGRDLIASTCSIHTQFNTQLTMYRGDDCKSLSCTPADTETNDDAMGSTKKSAAQSIGMEMDCSDVILSDNHDFNKIAQARGRSIRWTSEVGALYFIRVSGRDVDNDYGVVDFLIAPYNDICRRAIPLNLTASDDLSPTQTEGPVVRIQGSTEGARGFQVGISPEGARSTGELQVWYKVEGTGEEMHATTCNTQSTVQTRVWVYEIPPEQEETIPPKPVRPDEGNNGTVSEPLFETDGGSRHLSDAPPSPHMRFRTILDDTTIDHDYVNCGALTFLELSADDRKSCGSHHRVVWFAKSSVTYYIAVNSLGAAFDLEVGIEW